VLFVVFPDSPLDRNRPAFGASPCCADLEASGQSHGKFAQARGLALTSLRHWLYTERKARRQLALSVMVEVQWQAVEVIASVGVVELRFTADTDPAWLCEVLLGLSQSGAPC